MPAGGGGIMILAAVRGFEPPEERRFCVSFRRLPPAADDGDRSERFAETAVIKRMSGRFGPFLPSPSVDA